MPDLRELLAAEAARREPGGQPPFEVLLRAHRRRRARGLALTAGGLAVLAVAGVLALPALLRSANIQELTVVEPSTASANPTPKDGSPIVPCRTGDLRARFVSGGLGTGNDFGGIAAWNVAKHRCRLTGAVHFAAYYADGSLDRNAGPSSTPGPVSVLLQPGMTPYMDGTDGPTYLFAELQGLERDDPGQPDGMCRVQDKISPATLELRIGSVSLRVFNHDPNGDIKAIYGCHGRVLLNVVHGPPLTFP